MLSENDIKEELSYAYVHAVAARASFACERISKDRDSIDVTIRAQGRLHEESIFLSPSIDLQLKATSVGEFRDNHLIHDLLCSPRQVRVRELVSGRCLWHRR